MATKDIILSPAKPKKKVNKWENASTLTQEEVDAGSKKATPIVDRNEGMIDLPAPENDFDIKGADAYVRPQRTITPQQETSQAVAQAVENGTAEAHVKTPHEQYLDFLMRESANDAKKEKAQLNREMWTSIGEGIGSISDLVAANKEAPLPQNKQNLTDKMRERYTRLKAQADADRHARTNEYLRMLQQQRADEIAKDERNYKQKMLDYYNEREKRMQRNLDIQEGKAITDAQYKAIMADINQEKLEIQRMLAEHKISHEEAMERIAGLNAQANMLRAQKYQGGGSSGGSGGGVGEYEVVEKTEVDPTTGNKTVTKTRKRTGQQPTTSTRTINGGGKGGGNKGAGY